MTTRTETEACASVSWIVHYIETSSFHFMTLLLSWASGMAKKCTTSPCHTCTHTNGYSIKTNSNVDCTQQTNISLKICVLLDLADRTGTGL